jgi:hypothetical protein
MNPSSITAMTANLKLTKKIYGGTEKSEISGTIKNQRFLRFQKLKIFENHPKIKFLEVKK